jgi:hypothetical protein
MGRRRGVRPATRGLLSTAPVALSGGRLAEVIYEGDPDSRPVVHHRTVDTIGIMLRRGTITPEMEAAARDFAAAFTIAGLDTLRVPSLLRVPGAPRAPELADDQVAARQRVHQALEAVGGIGSPGGSVVWHVVGLQTSLREWALRQGWGGRPIGVHEARGILVAALGTLAAHSGHAQHFGA